MRITPCGSAESKCLGCVLDVLWNPESGCVPKKFSSGVQVLKNGLPVFLFVQWPHCDRPGCVKHYKRVQNTFLILSADADQIAAEKERAH